MQQLISIPSTTPSVFQDGGCSCSPATLRRVVSEVQEVRMVMSGAQAVRRSLRSGPAKRDSLPSQTGLCQHCSKDTLAIRKSQGLRYCIVPKSASQLLHHRRYRSTALPRDEAIARNPAGQSRRSCAERLTSQISSECDQLPHLILPPSFCTFPTGLKVPLIKKPSSRNLL